MFFYEYNHSCASVPLYGNAGLLRCQTQPLPQCSILYTVS